MDGVDYGYGRKMSCKIIGFNGESLVVEILENIGIPYQATGYKHPLDIIIPGFAIEVKTMTSIHRLYIKRSERRRKREWCQRNNVHGITVVVRPIEQYVDEPSGKIIEHSSVTYKDGFKSFDVTRMKDFEEILHEFYGEV